MARPRMLLVELLEDRVTPTTFGIPWPAASRLTLSFAPDQTPIADRPSELFAALEAVPNWQRTVLRAFQTWALHSNINIALRSDEGQPFGVAGRFQGDPRFGDIRIGAQPMSAEVLAVSAPPDLFHAGTWAGDLILNSTVPFTEEMLYRVALHEAGNILGLADRQEPDSVLFSRFTALTGLSAGDIAALQGLYGPRLPDAFEGPGGNDTLRTAALLRHPPGHAGAAPLVVAGDITTVADVDFFSIRLTAHYSGPVTIRLQTAGVSQLIPRLTVLDAAGAVLGEASSTDPMGAVLSVQLPAVQPNATLHFQVQGTSGDEFGVGGYRLAVSQDATLMVSPEILDAVLRGPFEALSTEDLDSLLRDPAHALLNDDQHSNDTFGRATVLSTSSFDFSNIFAEALGSWSDVTDIDFYRLRVNPSRSGQANVLTATIGAIEGGALPRLSLFDGSRRPVLGQVLVNGNGLFTIQAQVSRTGGAYFLRVSPPLDAADGGGNYVLQLHLGQRAAERAPLASGILEPAAPEQSGTLFVARSQLFRMTLSAEALGLGADAAVTLALVDGQGQEVLRLTASAGQTVTGPDLFLMPGAYSAIISLQAPSGDLTSPMLYRLWGSGLTDPIGPALEDPTLLPLSSTSSEPTVYSYPGDTLSFSDFLWVAVVTLLLTS